MAGRRMQLKQYLSGVLAGLIAVLIAAAARAQYQPVPNFTGVGA